MSRRYRRNGKPIGNRRVYVVDVTVAPVKVYPVRLQGISTWEDAHQLVLMERWGGSYGYLQIEHELTFLDPNGNPIEGVELRVEDQSGKEFFCFPVTDYLPGQTPKSDKDGVIRFHHVSTAVEWDN